MTVTEQPSGDNQVLVTKHLIYGGRVRILICNHCKFVIRPTAEAIHQHVMKNKCGAFRGLPHPHKQELIEEMCRAVAHVLDREEHTQPVNPSTFLQQAVPDVPVPALPVPSLCVKEGSRCTSCGQAFSAVTSIKQMQARHRRERADTCSAAAFEPTLVQRIAWPGNSKYAYFAILGPAPRTPPQQSLRSLCEDAWAEAVAAKETFPEQGLPVVNLYADKMGFTRLFHGARLEELRSYIKSMEAQDVAVLVARFKTRAMEALARLEREGSLVRQQLNRHHHSQELADIPEFRDNINSWATQYLPFLGKLFAFVFVLADRQEEDSPLTPRQRAAICRLASCRKGLDSLEATDIDQATDDVLDTLLSQELTFDKFQSPVLFLFPILAWDEKQNVWLDSHGFGGKFDILLKVIQLWVYMHTCIGLPNNGRCPLTPIYMYIR